MDTSENSSSGISYNDQQLLERCKEIELLSRDLYNRFAETYTDTPEAVHLWRKTAREEQNHADQFTLALKLRKGLNFTTEVSIEKAERISENLKITIANLTEKPMPLVESLAFAVRLERFLADLHLSCIAEFNDPSFAKLFKAMMSSDQEHVASIEALHEKLTSSPVHKD